MTRIATAMAIPKAESSVLTGFRSMLRKIIRQTGVSIWCTPRRSIASGLKWAGESGRIASAGGRDMADRSACSVPRNAADTLITAARAMTS